MLAAFSNLIMLITSVTKNGFFHSFWSQAHSKVFFFYLKCLKRISQTFNNVYAEVKKSTGTQNESTDIVEKKRKVNSKYHLQSAHIIKSDVICKF